MDLVSRTEEIHKNQKKVVGRACVLIKNNQNKFWKESYFEVKKANVVVKTNWKLKKKLDAKRKRLNKKKKSWR